MNKHTAKRLDAFLLALSAVRTSAAALAAQADGAYLIAQHNRAVGNLDGALATQITAIGHVSSEYAQVMEQFRLAAVALLGERPRGGEDDKAFFIRISKTDPLDWPAMARRNGKTLDLRDIGRALLERAGGEAK